MNAATRRLVAFTPFVVSCALPLAVCESDEKPTRDPGKLVTSAELAKLGCC